MAVRVVERENQAMARGRFMRRIDAAPRPSMRRPTFKTMPIGADPVAREVNARIRGQAEKFEIEPGTPLKFMCECGCMAEVASTISAFDAASGEVYVPGHGSRERPVREALGRLGLRRRSVASLR
jgi:hypothetical protein